MHNKYTLFVTLNEVNGLKKSSDKVKNDKYLCDFSNLLIYSYIVSCGYLAKIHPNLDFFCEM